MAPPGTSSPPTSTRPGWPPQVAHDPIAAPLGARFLAALADRVGAEPGVLDAVLVAPPSPAHPGSTLPPGRARTTRGCGGRCCTAPTSGSGRRRTAPGCWSSAAASRPLGGQRSRSTPPPRPRARDGARRRGTRLVPDEPVWAQVAPANTASLRAFLAAGYRPVAAEVLFGP